MKCLNPKCDGETLKVIRTHRNKRMSDKGFVKSINHDTREVYCDTCKTHYYQEMSLVAQDGFDENRISPKIIKLDKLKALQYDEVGTPTLFKHEGQ